MNSLAIDSQAIENKQQVTNENWCELNSPDARTLASEQPVGAGTLAGWLRGAGALAVIASAVVYMLQGLHNIDLDLRNWVYLALMGLMAGCGVASQTLLRDPKSTRLFFGLAALLIPVQFSQLGGLLHDLWTLPNAAAASPVGLVLSSLALALPVAYAAMSILARSDRLALTAGLVIFSAALLLPDRASVAGFVMLASLAAGTFALDQRIFSGQALYNNRQGKALQGLLAAPLVVALVRMCLHVDSMAGIAAMVGILAVLLVRVVNRGEIARLVGAALGVASCVVLAIELFPQWVAGDYGFSLTVLPGALWLMDVARVAADRGRSYRFYRFWACLLLVLSAASLLLPGAGVNPVLIALVHGAVALGWGVWRNQREPALAGALIAIAALGRLLFDAIGSVEVNSWIALGIGGVVLVFSASLLEKFGRHWMGAGRKAVAEVLEWG